jgi:site-specific recombinase XerD
MATLKFLIRGKTPLSPIYVRFIHTRTLDISMKTNIIANPKFWDQKKEQLKNVLEVKNRNEINLKLQELKLFIQNEFNYDYIQGEIIDRSWLQTKLNTFFNRPAGETVFKLKEEEVYFTSFATWWLDNKAALHKVSSSKYMSSKTIMHHRRLKDMFVEFEGRERVKLSEINGDILDKFSQFLSSKNYAEETVRRHLNRAKFFCLRAEELNIPINKGFKERVFVEKETIEYKSPYLSIEEINKIYNLNIEDQDIDAIRDNFIIGLWTGLRVSDFLNRLSTDNIKDGIILIKTLKTKHNVAIPLHPQVKAILDKRFGFLPPKCSDQHFNREIKNICKLAKINSQTLGGKVVVQKDKSKRKEVKHYPKYELVSSHICRRSFATNHFGKVPNKVIMDVCGWKSEKQMLDYNKQTNIESAIALAEYWEKEMKKLEQQIA